MNKKIITRNVWCIAVCLAIMACTGEDASPTVDGIPLQVELQNMLPTRTAITATTLPDGSQYGIYVAPLGKTVNKGDNGFNIPVSYSGGKSTMGRDYILQPATDYSVYAAYPQENNSDGMTLQLETASQTDYLYGYAVDNNGEQAVISRDNHVAKIQLRHAMALLKFNIFQSEDNKQENIVTGVRIPKNVTSCTLNLQTGERTNESWNTQALDCYLSVNSKPQSVDMLVLPNRQSVQGFEFCVNNKWIYTSVKSSILEGNCYTYNVEINSDAKIIISEAAINPRENETMETLTLNANILPIGGIVGIPVDLGLSVKWADHNLGASIESEAGGLYMWGDPTGTATFSTHSRPDLYEISSTQYDIATIQWGGNWQMPTYNEVIELIEKTSHQWTMRNGVEGLLFTSTIAGYTDKSIFFPYYRESSNYKSGSVWTGHRVQSNKTYATILLIDNKEGAGYNNAGSTLQATYAVRPVCK